MGPTSWVPIKKVLAAIITAVITSGVFTAWAAGSGDLSWEDLVRTIVPAILTAAVAYLVAPDARQAEQAIAAGKVEIAAPALTTKESPY